MDEKLKVIENWLVKAEHDFGMAKLALDNSIEYSDSICFHCQQYVEKILKAYLICIDIDFKRTHSLSYLLDLIVEKEHIKEEIYTACELLEDYAVVIRYPADDFEPSAQDANEAFVSVLKIKVSFEPKIKSCLKSNPY